MLNLDKQLIDYLPDNQQEDPQANSLRDHMDIFWYATEQELIEKLLQEIYNESID